jgi:hypothetical protein
MRLAARRLPGGGSKAVFRGENRELSVHIVDGVLIHSGYLFGRSMDRLTIQVAKYCGHTASAAAGSNVGPRAVGIIERATTATTGTMSLVLYLDLGGAPPRMLCVLGPSSPGPERDDIRAREPS